MYDGLQVLSVGRFQETSGMGCRGALVSGASRIEENLQGTVVRRVNVRMKRIYITLKNTHVMTQRRS